MGLNRFYTYNGQILKTAEGNPIGYEYVPPYPGTPSYRWIFNNSLSDSMAGLTLSDVAGTGSYSTGPNGYSSYLIKAGTRLRETTMTSFWDSIDAGFCTLSFWFKTAANNKYLWSINTTTACSRARIENGAWWVTQSWMGGNESNTGAVDISDGGWHHYLWRHDFSDFNKNEIFIDNVLKDTDATNGTSSLTGKIFEIGGFRNQYTNGADMYVALAYVYDSYLSTDDIAKLYTEGAA